MLLGIVALIVQLVKKSRWSVRGDWQRGELRVYKTSLSGVEKGICQG